MPEVKGGGSEWKKMLRLGEGNSGFVPGTEGHAWGRPMIPQRVDRRRERWDDKRADPDDGVQRTKKEFAEKYGSFVEWDFAKAGGSVTFPPAPRADLHDPDKELEEEWLERYGMTKKKTIEQKNREAFGKSFRVKTVGGFGRYGATDGGLGVVMESVGKMTRKEDPHVVNQETMDFLAPFESTENRGTSKPKSAQKWLDRIMDAAHDPEAQRVKQLEGVKREMIAMSAAFAGTDSAEQLAIDDKPREEGTLAITEKGEKEEEKEEGGKKRKAEEPPTPAAVAAASLGQLRKKPRFSNKFQIGQMVRFVGGGRFKAGGGPGCILLMGDLGTVETIDDVKNEYVVRFAEYGVAIALHEKDVRTVGVHEMPAPPAAAPASAPAAGGPGGMSDSESG